MLKKPVLFLLAAYVFACIGHAKSRECVPVDFDHGTTVCKCNDTYCDTVEENTRLPFGKVAQYRTSRFGDRLKKSILQFDRKTVQDKVKLDGVILTVNRSKIYQTLIGIGGAITDAAAMNTMSLKESAQELLLRSYFSTDGIEFSVLRNPIASCDYSPRIYSYDDVDGDFELEHFALQREDTMFKIPVMLRAMNMSRRTLNIFGSPWSAPAWMKTNNNMIHGGFLKGVAGNKYHKSFAQYFVKFIEEYKKRGIPIWGLTVENEPGAGYNPGWPWQSLGFNASTERDFVAKDLGPALHASGHSDVQLMIYDDQRPNIANWSKICISEETSKYVSGIAVHWYADKSAPPDILTQTHFQHPTKFILGTEACMGGQGPMLGNWNWTETIVNDVLDDLNNWLSGWLYWNSVLDMEGGPSWCENHQAAPIIVDAEKGVFYKDPMYYGLGQFSKFLPKGSQRIGLDLYTTHNFTATFRYIAFSVPEDGSTVAIMANTGDDDLPFHLNDDRAGRMLSVLPGHSITTFVWWV